jgi:hypothetical protein
VETRRIEELVGGGPQTTVTTTVTPTYYLRSTVLGGQAVAEINGQGQKKSGYVYVSKMQLAKLNVEQGNSVTWHHTDPVTGSSFLTDTSRNAFENKEIDPFGNNVTEQPPDPLPFQDPSYLDPNLGFFWPIQIEGSPTGEAESGMAEYAARVNASYDARMASYHWGKGRRDLAMEIVARNPNVGLEVRSFRVGFTVTFNIFGSSAANYLFGLSNRIASGDLREATPGEAAARLSNLRYGTVTNDPPGPVPRPGPDPNKKELPSLSKEHRSVLDNVMAFAGSIVANPELSACINYITGGRSVNAWQILDAINRGGGVRWGGSNPVLTAYTDRAGRGSGATIVFYGGFFTDAGNWGKIFKTDLMTTQAMIVLHELRHAITGEEHPIGSWTEAYNSNLQWNREIYYNCIYPTISKSKK